MQHRPQGADHPQKDRHHDRPEHVSPTLLVHPLDQLQPVSHHAHQKSADVGGVDVTQRETGNCLCSQNRGPQPVDHKIRCRHRRNQRRNPRLGHDAGDPGKDDHGHRHIDQRRPPGRPQQSKPGDHYHRPSQQPQHRHPIRHDLIVVAQLRFHPKKFPPNLLYVLPSDPQPQQHKGNKRSQPLVIQQLRGRDAPHLLLFYHPLSDKDPLFNLRQQGKSPNPRGDIRADQIGESQHGKTQRHVDRLPSKEGERPGHWKDGKTGDILPQSDKQPEDDRNRRPRPHRPAPEKRVDRLLLLLPANDRLRHLHQWIGQPLPVHPLTPQDHRRADHRHIEGEKKDAPQHHRPHPDLIRYGIGGRAHPLVKILVPIAIINHDRSRQVREEQFLPLVLRTYVVKHPGDRR